MSSSLLHSSKCRNLFHCLTSPAGELTQRKVRAGPCQGSAVQRKELCWHHVQKCCLSAIYFCQGCSNAIMVSVCSQAPESASSVQASPSLFVSSLHSRSYLFAFFSPHILNKSIIFVQYCSLVSLQSWRAFCFIPVFKLGNWGSEQRCDLFNISQDPCALVNHLCFSPSSHLLIKWVFAFTSILIINEKATLRERLKLPWSLTGQCS